MRVEKSDQLRDDGLEMWEVAKERYVSMSRLLTFEEMVDLRAELDRAIAMHLLDRAHRDPG